MMNNINILIAEEEPNAAADLKTTVKNLGYNVIGVANSGEEVLKILETKNVNIILINILLKGNLTGIETVKLICEKFDMPIIYLTSLINNEIIKSAMVTKHYGYILKPFNRKSLYSTIEMALYNYNQKNKIRNRAKLNNDFNKKTFQNLAESFTS